MSMITSGLGGLYLLTGGLGSTLQPPAPLFFEADLVSYLSSKGLTVFPDHVPQKTALPAITYTVVSDSPVYILKGSSGLTNRVVQLSIFSTLKDDVLSYDLQIRKVLNDFRGLMGSTTISTTTISNMFDRYDPNKNATDEGTYMRAVDYQFAF